MDKNSTRNRDLVLITGGSGGLGSAICRALAADGHDIALTYRSNGAAAERVVADCKSHGVEAEAAAVDLTDVAAVHAYVAQLAASRRLHSVVYASGPKIPFGWTSQLDPADWLKVMSEDTGGCFNLVHAAVPHMKAAGGGSIVAVITSAVERVPVQDVMSSAPKAAVEQLIRGIAKEEGRFGIRANCVGPGFIQAGLSEVMFSREDLGDFKETIRKSLPLKRFGLAEDVANCVSFLVSEKAAYITGQSIAVDGGLQL